jgi:hypothetical protein
VVRNWERAGNVLIERVKMRIKGGIDSEERVNY